MATDDDTRYEQLMGRYNAVVTERDLLAKSNERLLTLKTELTAEVIKLRGAREVMALVCDNKCGAAICGPNEEAIRAEATRAGWFNGWVAGVANPPSGRAVVQDLCSKCRPQQ